jgi:MFS family permease
MPVLLFAAVLAGVSWAVFSVLNPLFARAYFTGEGMAAAVARLSLASGIAWAIGAAAGGFLLHVVAPGWGLLIRALLGVPFAIYLIAKPPAVEPPMPESREPVWSGMRDRLRDNPDLRRATLLGCGVTAAAAPMASLIVPIVDALRQSPLLPGAGILSASMAGGEMFAPVVVSKLERRRTDLRAAAVAAIVCGGALVLYAIGSYALSRRPELAMWAVIGVAYGAFRFASKALNVGAATASDTEENSVESVATLLFITGLAAPVGVLAWGFLINRWSVEAAVLIGAAATTASAAAVLALTKRDP